MIERLVYNYFALPLGLAGYRLISLFDQKARIGFAARKNLLAALKEKVSGLPAGNRVLVHISSVGEYLQVRPVLRLLRKKRTETKIILSFYSPSLEPAIQKGVEAEFATYLPFDRPRNAAEFLETLKPPLIVFSCYDLWPNLIWRAKDKGIKTALVNANLAQNSGKLNPLVRWWFAKIYRELDLILAASEEDARTIAALGVLERKIITAGNARFDETIARIDAIPRDDDLISALASWRQTDKAAADATIRLSPCLVIGSSWPEDEAMLIPALEKIWSQGKNLKVIIAPHEIEPGHIKELKRQFEGLNAEPVLLSEMEAKAKSVSSQNKAVIADSVGKLYKLYKICDFAFVGGSFRKEVHNVMEPAGFGVPVLFGPKIKNSLEALKLKERKGGFIVHSREEFYRRLISFMDDEKERLQAGERAYQLVLENQGAGERIVKLLLEKFPEVFNMNA